MHYKIIFRCRVPFNAKLCILIVLMRCLSIIQQSVHAAVPIDLSAYSSECGIAVNTENERLAVQWPLGNGHTGHIVFDLDENEPLIEQLSTVPNGSGEKVPLLTDVDAAFFLTVGSRRTPSDKPPEQKWQVFFDNPVQRPHESFGSELTLTSAEAVSSGRRAAVRLHELKIGGFQGWLEFTFYAECPLVHVEAVVNTEEDMRAIIYDAGFVSAEPNWRTTSWVGLDDKVHTDTDKEVTDRPVKVRYRTIMAESDGGSVACFPPPHQFQFPRDWSDNLGFVWYGQGHLEKESRFGIGVRQAPDGGGPYVPWFNASPGTQQRLGVFLLASPSKADDALAETLRFTHGDRFPEIPGYRTFTSHYHMAITVAAMDQIARGISPLPTPDFVDVFKRMGVDIVHIAEFHGDGHQKDGGHLRIREVQGMFDECERLSDEKLLFIPGEEVNTFLGLNEEGKHPGHWMSLFPKPIHWIMQREEGQLLVADHPVVGKVYRVGNRDDMTRLVEQENALVWAAHPRIKASSWTPDIFRNSGFYLADSWLGGAWKAMPGDLSRERLGERVLDLLSDMANWGQRKYVLGEVDVFKIDNTHELYGHMNINYLKMDRLPRFEDGWQSVLDTLRSGKFFVTTGEVLVPRFTVGGKESGDELELSQDTSPEVTAEIEWTFPLKFAEIISGDGKEVYRERIDLADTTAFGTKTLKLSPDLAGRKWVRFEVWDVAVNGAFTQPVWLIASE